MCGQGPDAAKKTQDPGSYQHLYRDADEKKKRERG